MTTWKRRDILKSGLAAGASLLAPKAVHALSEVGSLGDSPEPLANAEARLANSPRERTKLDRGWRFHLGAHADPAMGFEPGGGGSFAKAGRLFPPSSPAFDDSSWRAVDLPHDWAIELPFVADPRLTDWGFKPLHRDYPETSIAWYRKVFTLGAADAGRRLSLEFDGVFRDCTVALNGHLLGRNLSGYAPFSVDITDVAALNGRNVLVVRVDATEHEGWFYEGAGIYRHVWLVKTANVHVPQWGTYVTSEVSGRAATVRVVTSVANDSDAIAACRLTTVVRDANGRTLASAPAKAVSIAPWSSGEARQEMTVRDPALWSPDAPNLYTLATVVDVNGSVVDAYETTFGIRTIRFDANEGFFLNGARLEIKGTCNHQDHAGVGAALPDRLQYYRVERLKEMGTNAYRTSHNPPTPELLDACDRLGMLVLDESRMFGSSDEALSQLERMLRRDRNHPSVIAWSIANEEPSQGAPRGERIGAVMARLVRRLDPSRPVTAAMDQGWGEGLTRVVDIQGFNYRATQIDGFHTQHPSMPVWGTETGSTVSTRGVYANDKDKGYVSAYDVNAPWWASTAEAWWTIYATRKWLMGGFIWTGFDYRGEPTPYAWPCINSHFGVFDTCGFPKDNFHYYQAWWTDKPVLHLLPHWNWSGREGQDVDVWCHSNLESVELLVNGKSLGRQEVPRNSHVAWKVPYVSGRLEARGFRGGTQVLTDVRETTGPAARILLRPDRAQIVADGEDVALVTAAVVDAQGRTVPIANDAITFDVSGSGKLLGVGNGDPSSHESDLGPTRRAFNGLCMAIAQAGESVAPMRVHATAPGLEAATIEIACTESPGRPSP
jgi:beta-galactosidase